MKSAFLLPLLLCLLCGCVSHVRFAPYSISSRPVRAPVALGVAYAEGDLAMIHEYKVRQFIEKSVWKIYVGEALDAEVLTRLRPGVERMVLLDSPNPAEDLDAILFLDIESFEIRQDAAWVRLRAELRDREGRTVFKKVYSGGGSPNLRRVGPSMSTMTRELYLTTREAMTVALKDLPEDLRPWLKRPAAAALPAASPTPAATPTPAPATNP